MDDHKNISKSYPASFDPSLYTYLEGTKPLSPSVTFVSPFRMMCCFRCKHFIARGKEFHDAQKEISSDSSLGIKYVLLHAKCPNCSAPIIIQVDPQNSHYRIMTGASRGYEPRRDEERERERESGAWRLERFAEYTRDEVVRPKMEDMQIKQEDTKIDVAVAAALNDVRAVNARRDAMLVEMEGIAEAPKLKKEEEDDVDASTVKAALSGAEGLARVVVKEEDVAEELNVGFQPRKRARED